MKDEFNRNNTSDFHNENPVHKRHVEDEIHVNFVEADNPFQSRRTNDEEHAVRKSDLENQLKTHVIHNPENHQVVEEPQEDEKPEGKQKSKFAKVLNKVIMVVAILVFLVSGSILAKHFIDIEKSKSGAEKLASMIANGEEQTESLVGEDGILEKYRDAYNTNNDLVGWIKIPNTTIDHPVVKAADNEKYLRKSFYGTYDKRGTIFMDYHDHVDELCKNTILYGHNYLDSTMFSDVENYKSIDFYKKSPVIQFGTIYQDYYWKVFAVYLTNAEDQDDNGYTLNYIYPFMTDDNFEAYITEVYTRTLYYTNVDVKKTDKILTLSTCTRDMDIKGNGQTNARCVVLARLVRDGESTNVDTSSTIINDNPKYPQIWYTAHNQSNPYEFSNRWVPEGVEY